MADLGAIAAPVPTRDPVLEEALTVIRALVLAIGAPDPTCDCPRCLGSRLGSRFLRREERTS